MRISARISQTFSSLLESGADTHTLFISNEIFFGTLFFNAISVTSVPLVSFNTFTISVFVSYLEFLRAIFLNTSSINGMFHKTLNTLASSVGAKLGMGITASCVHTFVVQGLNCRESSLAIASTVGITFSIFISASSI
jgi:hypothetical protein